MANEDPGAYSRSVTRRGLLALVGGVAALPLVGLPPIGRARAAVSRNLHFQVLRDGSQIGEHRIDFRADGDRLAIVTQIDIKIEALIFSVFRFMHRSEEIWDAGRLVSIESITDDDGTALQVSGGAVPGGFRIVGIGGPFLAASTLMTSNTLWDPRIVRESRLLDAQRGGEMGLIARQLPDELVETSQGHLRTSCYLLITPLYAGRIFYDADNRWVKALLELRGQNIEYALAT
jgi:hypothetical protein